MKSVWLVVAEVWTALVSWAKRLVPKVPFSASVAGVFGTVWAWIAWAAIGLWRSFWAVWGNALTYPILGAVAFAAFSIGHHEGHKGTAGALARLAAAESQLRGAHATVLRQGGEIVMLRARASLAPSVATPPTPPSTPTIRRRATPPTPPAQPATWWPF